MSAWEKKPEVIVFAGPNGSGKSTFTELLKPPVDYINADEIKKNLKCSDLEAAQLAEKQREEHLGQMREFCFETVLSTERNLGLLKRAKDKGYFIRCYYILTADPMINIWRIKSRVAAGGHDVPEEKIIARYDRALYLIKDLLIFPKGTYKDTVDALVQGILYLMNKPTSPIGGDEMEKESYWRS